MARPRLDKTEKRSCNLPMVRCSESDYDIIRARAKLAGTSLSAYMRQAALNAQVSVQPRSSIDPQLIFALNELGRELNKLGNNFNQMTRIANTVKDIPAGLEGLCGKLDIVLDQVMATLIEEA